jgi:hypothetical protein
LAGFEVTPVGRFSSDPRGQGLERCGGEAIHDADVQMNMIPRGAKSSSHSIGSLAFGLVVCLKCLKRYFNC